MMIAVVRYRTQNIGDDIQSLALERLLPRVDLRIDRDDLTPARDWGEDVRWVVNGWYASGAHKHWPPQTRAKTLFVGLHANDPDAIPRNAASPIGCRDPWTIHLCARHGIDAWLSWCATLTLEPAYGPRTDDVLLVDVAPQDLERLPPRIAAGTKLTHTVPRDCDRVAEATRRLNLYAKARWVVTNRLHILLPCAAMGTPVVFVRPPNSENRFTGYTHLGWRIADAPWDEPRPAPVTGSGSCDGHPAPRRRSEVRGLMKLAALCCTFHRPHLLGQLVESFLCQDYPRHLRELVILDDAGQYENQAGEGWRLISVPARFRTLGEKRNACAALASPDAEGFLVADDDDVYLPHWFSTQAEALKKADWSRPSLVLLAHGDGLKEHDTGGLYHGGWALRREAFDRVRGYAALNNGEDQELARRLTDAKVSVCDPCAFTRPFYHYRVDTGSYHLSYLDDAGYRDLGKKTTKGKHKLQPGWPRDFTKLPVVKRFTCAPHVSHRDGQMPVELIGPVHASGRDGPTNGMYALQKELRKRIAGGLDWLSIKSLPASDGALPWFWHWDDRRYAVWWDSEGRPFVQGPNMLFTYSWKPRIDAEERGLLDAANCRAMFCHSDWYRDLIAKNRGPANTAPIVTWPYPIDPWPGEPLPDEYDLLIYSKNGHRPGLLEHLCEVFPRHVVLHYGQYKRAQLFEAARRSRACAYLADDDHGPLALQEILLAGCPVVGVRTGAPFIQDGVTGMFLDRLPPGAKCVKNDADAVALATFVEGIQYGLELKRDTVRASAIERFGTAQVADRILREISSVRD